MIVNANMSQEVFDYFKGYDLSDVANCLLEQYDFTALPQTTGKREVERKINVTDPVYIQLYQTVGPRSKKISLGRLFEFAFNMDVLSNEHFRVKPTGRIDNPVPNLIEKAYKTLLEARKYSDDPNLKELVDIVYNLKGVIK